MQKRGQVTIFIILGLVILSSVGFIYLVKNEYFKSEFEKQRDKVIVPEQLKPVSMYLDSCVASLAEEGAKLIGVRGGYYDGLPEDLIPRSVVNPFSNSLIVLEGLEVPYWFYLSANNLPVYQVPSLKIMESEILSYVSDNFYDYCVVELNKFVEQGYEIDIHEQQEDSSVNIKDTHIEIIYSFPIEAELNDVSFLIEKHIVTVEATLGDLYKSAVNIIEKENEEFFLEEKTIDIMSVFDEIPYSEIEFTCKEKTWVKTEVVSKFKQLVSDNIGGLNIEGTNFEGGSDIYDYFVLDINKIKSLDNANFFYSTSWPFVVDVAPEKNGILIADDITNGIAGEIGNFLYGLMCLNTYNFVYDVKYPVLVTLIGDDGFIFQFATQVVVDNNQPRKNTAKTLVFDSEGELGETYCGNGAVESEVVVFDAETMIEVENADVTFKCMATECRLGKTDVYGSFATMFPPCMNGLVTATKEGYYESSETFSTNVASQTTIFVQPKYNVNYNTKIISGDYVRDLENNENVIFIFDNLDNDFNANAEGSEGEIELIAGDYLVKSYLTKSEDFKVELSGETISKCVEIPRPGLLGLFLKKEECFEVELEDIELEEIIIGGVEFEFNIDNYELSNANSITLYNVFDRMPTQQEDLSQIFENIKTNHLLDSFRYPYFE
jgi:hypothetical protein